ncbi:MAG: oligopeptide/dipeptide ABC transporter ATP-binding protein [Chloroflexota bacterium]
MTRSAQPLLQIRNLKKHFPVRSGVFRRQTGAVQAVDGLNFDIYPGETVGLVGESGSGKSTTGRSILQLLKPTDGSVVYKGQELTKMSRGNLRKIRSELQMVFQDPYAALNPRMTVSDIVAEPLNIHKKISRSEQEARVSELLNLVGLNDFYANRHPHEFSGGQRQRIGIARALATNPTFLVADEPVSALDVSIQAQVVNLLDDLKQELGLTYLFIAHDLSMVRYISDRVAVMYLGRIVELAARDALFEKPLHPYTQALLSAIPIPDPEKEARRQPIELKGNPPDPANPPSGCRFHPRCGYATTECEEADPQFRNLGTAVSPHFVACHYAERFR